jgi:transcriptional regulator with XRE-family HTH domain
MGRANRPRPKWLGEKLYLIRSNLGLTQPELIKRLAVKGEKLSPSAVSKFESGQREPSLLALLRYAKLAGVSMEELVDDKIKLRHKDLPKGES